MRIGAIAKNDRPRAKVDLDLLVAGERTVVRVALRAPGSIFAAREVERSLAGVDESERNDLREVAYVAMAVDPEADEGERLAFDATENGDPVAYWRAVRAEVAEFGLPVDAWNKLALAAAALWNVDAAEVEAADRELTGEAEDQPQGE